jgi:hypothetical protein
MKKAGKYPAVSLVLSLAVLGALGGAPFSFGQDVESAAAARTVSGTVQEIDWVGAKIAVNVHGDSASGEGIAFIVPDEAVLTRGSDELELSDIDQGDQVEITYVNTDSGFKVVRLNDTNMANAE